MARNPILLSLEFRSLLVGIIFGKVIVSLQVMRGDG